VCVCVSLSWRTAVLKIDNFFPGASPFIFGCVREFFVELMTSMSPQENVMDFVCCHTTPFIYSVRHRDDIIIKSFLTARANFFLKEFWEMEILVGDGKETTLAALSEMMLI